LTALKLIPASPTGREFELGGSAWECTVCDKGKAGTVRETEHLLVGEATGRSLRKLLVLRLQLGRGGGEGRRPGLHNHPFPGKGMSVNFLIGPKRETLEPPEEKVPDATFVQPTSPNLSYSIGKVSLYDSPISSPEKRNNLLSAKYKLNSDYSPFHADQIVRKRLATRVLSPTA